ncbi:uncharacterized protein SAPINGB_P004150 [Magnusiomyces paraingens]|uniref:Uncharacterized protein n=1 Tax=Magnusiomyces paraingens TaxID=2606893 RepID=A0A5E8BYF2_9ASCO|nr:uncharacterized protein SAPINGB_P004150 [Saprochaete ingens]VVT54587.1 unnamed protein product [Saprochaete ingens]
MTVVSTDEITLCTNTSSTPEVSPQSSTERWVALTASAPLYSIPNSESNLGLDSFVNNPQVGARAIASSFPRVSLSNSSVSSASPWLCYRNGKFIRHRVTVISESAASCCEETRPCEDQPAPGLTQQANMSVDEALVATQMISPLSPRMPFSCHLKTLHSGYEGVFPENRKRKKPRSSAIRPEASDIANLQKSDAHWYYRNIVNADVGLSLTDFDIVVNDDIAADMAARETLAVKNRIILCSLTLTIPIFLYLRFTFWT